MVFAQEIKKTKVLVVGARGMLGATLCPLLEDYGCSVTQQSRQNGIGVCFDPLDVKSVVDVLLRVKPDVVINLAACSNVDQCESDINLAYMANVRTVESLVKAVEVLGCQIHLVQISTDHLYDGVGPHSENAVFPCNVYALTKYAGELVALQATTATVLRTNFFGRSRVSGRVSFTDWIFNSARSGRDFTLLSDVYFSALSMNTLAKCVFEVITKKHCGVFNLGCSDGMSKSDFALAFLNLIGVSSEHAKIGCLENIDLLARRPRDMRMNVARFESQFGFSLPTMQEEIAAVAKYYKE